MSKEALREEVAALAETIRELREELAAQRAATLAPHCCGHARAAPAGWWWCSSCNSLAWGSRACTQRPVITYCGTLTTTAAAVPGAQQVSTSGAYTQTMANAGCAGAATTYMIN